MHPMQCLQSVAERLIMSRNPLSHIINTNFNDNNDTESRKNSFIGQVNKVLVHFSKLDPFIKTRLFKSFCSRYYPVVNFGI